MDSLGCGQGHKGESPHESITVCIRMRPLSAVEKDAGQKISWAVPSATTISLPLEKNSSTSSVAAAAGHYSTYSFDRVFHHRHSSQDVYEGLVSPLILSAMQGLNVTIFAYGQTGSGKTYTMTDVTQRAGAQIFDYIKNSKDKEFLIRLSVIEIYNEVVHDLMIEDSPALRVFDDKERGPVVEGLTEDILTSQKQLNNMIATVATRRQVHQTRHNDKSSRSHAITRFYIESRPAASFNTDCENNGFTSTIASTINFVDLAGSERAGQQSIKDVEERRRLKEGCHINRSLLTLGTVIRCLGENNTHKRHVPYRDSRLTRILQPALSGNSRMAIICTISPATDAVEMSKAALHFATCAKQVVMRPKINTVVDKNALLLRLQAETADLKKQIEQLKSSNNYAELTAELKKKDEEIIENAKMRELLQRKLNNLEKLVLTGDSRSVTRRVSFSDSRCESRLMSSRIRDNIFLNSGIFYGPWKTGDSISAYSVADAENPQFSPLQYSLSPQLRENLKSMGAVSMRAAALELEGLYPRSQSFNEKLLIDSYKSKDFQVLRGIEKEMCVDEGLREELAFITRQASGGDEGMGLDLESSIKTICKIIKEEEEARDMSTERSEMLHNLKKELRALEQSQVSFNTSKSLIDNLEKKFHKLSAPLSEESSGSKKKLYNKSPRQRVSVAGQENKNSIFFEFSMDTTKSSSSCSPSNHKNNDGEEVRGVVNDFSPRSVQFRAAITENPSKIKAMTQNQQCLDMTNDVDNIVETTEEDLMDLRECLDQLKKENGRLSFQKIMLLKQVFSFEERLGRRWDKKAKNVSEDSEDDEYCESIDKFNSFTEKPLNLKHRSLKSQQQRSTGGVLVSNGHLEKEIWTQTPAGTESLLSKIVCLWDELAVPLVRRSKLYLAFKKKEIFFQEAEYRRLLLEKSQVAAVGASSDSKSHMKLIKSKKLHFEKSIKVLKNEKKWLASKLKWNYSNRARLALFEEWNVSITEKNRKLKLINKLWHQETIRVPDGMLRSATLILDITGECDIADDALSLIFNSPNSSDLEHLRSSAFFGQLSHAFVMCRSSPDTVISTTSA